MNIKEDIKIVKEFNEKNRFRDCGRLNNAIDHILEEREEDKKKIKELEEHQQKFYNGEIYTAKQLKQVEENQKKYFINKQKVKEGLEDIEDYFDRLNGPDEDMEYIRNIKKELLEDK